MKLSKTKQDELYSTVHEEIMKVRIRLTMAGRHTMRWEDMDHILSDLCISSPQAAIDVFKEKK